MPIKTIPPISSKNGKPVINLHCSVSNDAWLHALRLKGRAEDGSEEAEKEFEEIDQTDMVYYHKPDEEQ